MDSPLRERSFRALTATQFLGAFNDNLFKQLLLLLAARWLFPGEDQQGIAFAVFALPFILWSGLAGDISERFSKRSVVVWMKVVEIAVMLVGAVALQLRNWPLLLAVLFLMGAQSAFFGPSKYGIIPELVRPAGLMRANGTIAMTTFLSILLGQALAGPLLDSFGDRLWVSGAVCTLLAVVGWIAACGIVRLPPTRPEQRIGWNPFGSMFTTIAELRAQRSLWRLVLVNSTFWFNGGVLQQAVNGLGGDRWLAIGPQENTLLSLLLVTLAASIMVGCVVAPRLVRVLSPARMVVSGAVLMVLGQAALMLVGPVLSRADGGYALAHAALALAGFAGALFVVPVQTLLQAAPAVGLKGKTFAVNNFCNFVCIFLAGGFYQVGSWLKVPPAVTAAAAGALLLLMMLAARAAVRRLQVGVAERQP